MWVKRLVGKVRKDGVISQLDVKWLYYSLNKLMLYRKVKSLHLYSLFHLRMALGGRWTRY